MSFKICFRGLLKKKNVEWQTEKSTYLYDTRNYQNNRDVTRIENEAFFMCLHFYSNKVPNQTGSQTLS